MTARLGAPVALAGDDRGDPVVRLKVIPRLSQLGHVDAALGLQANDEVGAITELAGNVDLATCRHDDLAADAESKADSLLVAGCRLLQLAEVEEQLLLIVFGDSTAGVSERDVEAHHLLDQAVVQVPPVLPLLDLPVRRRHLAHRA